MEKTTRNLTGGEVLTARFKKREYRAAVVKTAEGIRIGLPDGRLFTSVSAAGQAIMKHACNGHRFWAVETEATKAVRPTAKPKRQRASRAKAPAAQPKPEATVTVEMTPEQKREAREEEQATQPTEAAVEA